MGCCGSKTAPEEDGPSSEPEKVKVAAPASSSAKKKKKKSAKKPEFIAPWRKEKLEEKQKLKESETGPLKEVEVLSRIPLCGHEESSNIDVCAWSPTESVLVTAGFDRKVFLWNLGGGDDDKTPVGKELHLESSSDGGTCVHWSNDGKRFAVGSERGYVQLYSSDGEMLDSWHPHEKMVKAVKMNKNLVLSVGDLICVYGTAVKNWVRFNWSVAVLTDAEWLDDAQFLVADINGTITLDKAPSDLKFREPDPYDFDMDPEVPPRQFVSHLGGVYKVARSPHSSKVFASCSVDCTVKVWDVGREQPLFTCEGHFGYVVDLVWISAKRLASASYDGTARIWDTEAGLLEGECVHELVEHQDPVVSITASSDGAYVATASHDGSVNVWSVQHGDVVLEHEGPDRMLQAAFSRSKGGKVAGSEYLAAASFGVVDVLSLKFNPPPPRPEKKKTEDAGSLRMESPGKEDKKKTSRLRPNGSAQSTSSRRRDSATSSRSDRRKKDKDGRREKKGTRGREVGEGQRSRS